MKKLTFSAVVLLLFCSQIAGQCPTAVYSNAALPLPPGSTVTVVVDSSGSGVSSLGISITPDPGNAPPKFGLSGTAGNLMQASTLLLKSYPK